MPFSVSMLFKVLDTSKSSTMDLLKIKYSRTTIGVVVSDNYGINPLETPVRLI